MKQFLQAIANKNNFTLHGARALAGGDINKVFLLNTSKKDLVIKINDADKFPKMFEAEAKGLELLRASQSFIIPKVVKVGKLGKYSYLLMRYLNSENQKPVFWQDFARNLAKLHHSTSSNYGLDHDNYIGSLPQKNTFSKSASHFYIEQRLQPQFEIAFKRGFSFNDLEKFYKNIADEIPEEKPSLIHGDLWHGNYLTTTNGKPALIDPAVSFGPREMDIALMKLFGGYSVEVFNSYNSIFPLETGWERRVSLWQLYYLLVHLNIFGRSYFESVEAIILKFR